MRNWRVENLLIRPPCERHVVYYVRGSLDSHHPAVSVLHAQQIALTIITSRSFGTIT